MNINEVFTSKYLKSADLQGEVVRVKIREATVEEIGTDHKMILYFVNKERGMVLNRTNARTIGDAYGDDTDEWIGKPIEVFSMKVDFQGRMVDGLRVRVPKRVGQQQQRREPVNEFVEDAENPAPRPSGSRPRPNVEPDMDDSIPF